MSISMGLLRPRGWCLSTRCGMRAATGRPARRVGEEEGPSCYLATYPGESEIMRSVIVAGLLIAVAGCAYPVKTAHVPDPTYAQTHTTPAPSCTPASDHPDHGPGRFVYEVCVYAVAQSRCLDLAEPSRQSCLASLTEPSPLTPEEIREAQAASPHRLFTPSLSPPPVAEGPSIVDQMERDHRMDELQDGSPGARTVLGSSAQPGPRRLAGPPARVGTQIGTQHLSTARDRAGRQLIGAPVKA
jgi:hypothetical protein